MIDKVENPQVTGQHTIQTSRFGEIEIDAEKIITMTSPILGFPDERHYVLLPHNPESALFWLQSTNNPELAFIVISPQYLTSDYDPPLTNAVFDELRLEKDAVSELMVIITIPPGNPREMTANFLGPIVFNPQHLLAKQVVLDPRSYDPCWPVPLK